MARRLRFFPRPGRSIMVPGYPFVIKGRRVRTVAGALSHDGLALFHDGAQLTNAQE